MPSVQFSANYLYAGARSAPVKTIHLPALHLVLAAFAVVVCSALGSALGERVELERQTRQLDVDASLRRELLRSEIERHRLLPTVLSRNPELSLVLNPRIDATQRSNTLAKLNRDFDELARTDGAATLYLVDQKGLTVAASNYALSTSFVGQDYSFRAYFRDAMRTGIGELFAQGTVSGVPGLYLAQRLDSRLGVVVTKVEFTDLEKTWRVVDDETLVVDRNGVVLLTSNPAQRFTTLATAPRPDKSVIQTELAASYQDWRIVLRRDISAPLLTARVLGASLGALLGLLAAAALSMTIAGRRRREQQRKELERLVANRTFDLESSNRKLLHEIQERIRSEATVQQLREDLAQANRLAILGQIAAGVAHEINQPTAAIRTNAENAKKFFQRNLLDEGLAALTAIISLTERIGLITDELRNFSRRSPTTREPVLMREVIDGSRLLLEQSLRLKDITLQRPDAPELQSVMGNRTRLEQVLVNLVQNAMDALADTSNPEIIIRSQLEGNEVFLRVIDNGPGVPIDRQADLFAPFSSSKPLGLGLGLVISRDLLSDMGGSLSYQPRESGGAIFTVCLPAGRS